MKAYIFIYNVVPIKANLSELQYEKEAEFILIGSNFCIEKLSIQNKNFFHHIHSIERNFHQIDFEKVDSILSTYLKKFNPQEIMLLTNEDSTQIVSARLREKYGIPGVTESLIAPFVNKEISKNKLLGKIRTPKFLLLNKEQYRENPLVYKEHLIESIGFPMFLKPIDLVSSIGTFAIFDEETLDKALNFAHQAEWDFELDEFIDGDLFHCDFIVQNGKICLFMAGKYAHGLAEFSKGKPMGSIPVSDKELFFTLKKFSEAALSSLGFFPSAFHLEVFQDRQSKELIFLEAAARTPGALVPEMYEKILNKHIEQMHYQVQIGKETISTTKEICKHAGWITYPKQPGILDKILTPKIDIEHQVFSFVSKGEDLEKAESLLDSAYSVIFWDESPAKIAVAFESLKAHNPLVMIN